MLNFQDGIGWKIKLISSFYDLIIVYILTILVAVLMMARLAIISPFRDYKLYDSNLIEFLWSTGPAVIILLIITPSISILYEIDSTFNNTFLSTFKITGHQWFWRYSLVPGSSLKAVDIDFSSYYLTNQNPGIRILEVDSRIVVPYGFPVRVVVTREDVIHSWAVPALGSKMDGVPGRLNQFEILVISPGVFYGQCREICGRGHRFIPIVVNRISFSDYKKFIYIKLFQFET